MHIPGGVRKATKTGHHSTARGQQDNGMMQQLCVSAQR